ncbi:MAG: hypothetical protein KDE51_04055 [Anaerolineales bacterium]|nr:hypothetical protein [Anaerolineales bacterium]
MMYSDMTLSAYETSPSHQAAVERLAVQSETGRLHTVIIGYPDNFDLEQAEIINETQKLYYFGANRPQKEKLIREMDGYVACLEANGVQVLRPRPVEGVHDQLMTRDIGVVIGNTFLLTHMASPSRQREWLGIMHHLQPFMQQVVRVPEHIIIEGGDIVVDKGHIFVGISQRTTWAGAEWLAAEFPQYNVVPVELKRVSEGENVLHLDCAFVPVGAKHALIYPDGFAHMPAEITAHYEFIPVSRAEQDQLGTNVLSISPTQVISRAHATRINAAMRTHGLEVFDLPFAEAPKTGGSFRCCSLPLWRA